MLNHNLSPSFQMFFYNDLFQIQWKNCIVFTLSIPFGCLNVPKSRWIGCTKIIGNDFHQKDLRKWKPNSETARLVQNNLKFSHNKYQINFLQWQKKSKWFPRTIKYICTQCNFPFSIFLQRPKRNRSICSHKDLFELT